MADGRERSSEFPIICESCLGDNPYVRMMKAPGHGKECKICTRRFTVFRWSAGRGARYKKTEICQTCSRLKNVCQVCVLDLEYGLPVQVRDAAAPLSINSIPKSHVNREYFAEEHDRSRAPGGIDYESSSFGKARANDTILKLQRTTPYYKRNRPHVCSYYVRGGCKRGSECPYRHEMPPVTGELSQQNIKDRYHGVNDPVALKLLNKAAGEMPSLEPRAALNGPLEEQQHYPYQGMAAPPHGHYHQPYPPPYTTPVQPYQQYPQIQQTTTQHYHHKF